MELRRDALNTPDAPADPEPWDEYEYAADLAELEELTAQLAEIGGQLDWTIDGQGVYGHLIAMGTLGNYVSSLRGLLRWTARDITVEEGTPRTDVSTWQLVEPVFAGTFEGSVGLRITRSPVVEHVEMGSEPLFDRTVEKVLSVLTTLKESESRTEIVAVIARLRRNSVAHLRSLAETIVASGAPSQVRWRGGDPITVLPSDASELVEILATVSEQDESRVITGRMPGGDVDDKRFHLVADAPPGIRPQEFRGDVDPALRDHLRRFHFGDRVRATITVTYTDSPFSAVPSESYTLVAIEPLGESDADNAP